MKKKQVLIVAHHLTVGGVQKTLLAALKALDYEKYDITLYLRKNRLALLPYVDERVKVIVNEDSTHYYRKPYAIILQLAIAVCKVLRLREKICRLEKVLADKIRTDMMEYEKKTYFQNKTYDIAISYVQGYTAEFVAQCVKAGKKIVFYHGSTDDMHDLHIKIMDEYDRIVAVNSSVQQILSKWYPEYAERMGFLENYVDAKAVLERSKEKTIAKMSDVTILCSCGRFASVKGFDLAVEAAKILKDRNIPFVWYFVGDGPERRAIEQKIEEYGMQDAIILEGMQDNPYPWIANCDLYVQPSYEESHSLTIVEAMILCCPVVSTKTVGGQYLIKNGENGFLVEIDKESIADGIQRVIESPELYQNVVEHLKSIDHSNDFEKYKSQWKRLLEEL